MKVHLIRKETIEDYVARNAQSRARFGIFLSLLKYADWEIPEDIKQTFQATDILGADREGNMTNRVIFDIGGNKYRMICKYHFGDKEIHLYIKWIGTHAEYDKLCTARKKEPNQYNINAY